MRGSMRRRSALALTFSTTAGAVRASSNSTDNRRLFVFTNMMPSPIRCGRDCPIVVRKRAMRNGTLIRSFAHFSVDTTSPCRYSGKPNLGNQIRLRPGRTPMARPAAHDLTERELEVMHVFWRFGELTAADARDRLAEEGPD